MAWEQGVMIPAYAKINLTLEVLRRRADGYHELFSVMQTIALHDTLALRPTPAGTYTLACDVPELAGEDNLALRAARMLAETLDPPPTSGVAIELRKEVPTQAGLGGGSSDAAYVLAALDRLWGGHLTYERYRELAARLGSDVPFFGMSGAALVRGRGEHVEGLPDGEPLWLVLLKPPVEVSTAAAFAALTAADFADGAVSDAVAQTLRGGRPVPLERLFNSFEPSVLRDYPVVARAWGAFHAAGASVVRLSGSGPTLYAPFSQLLVASEVERRLRAEGHRTWLTHTIGRSQVLNALGVLA